MDILNFSKNDLNNISHLQPKGWGDIKEHFIRYNDYKFTSPYKVVLEDKIVGLGVTIEYGNTSWIAHIIVDKNHRNKGIGKSIVKYLCNYLIDKKYETI